MSDDTKPRTGAKAGRAGLRDDGRLSAPGQLQQGDKVPTGDLLTAQLPAEDLAAYASEHGLWPAAQRPKIPEYVRQLWRRRSFMLAFATARNVAMYTEARLGQAWQILTPLLNAGVYFLIFGVLLHVSRGIPNYLGFLVAGVFVFNFTQRSFISTSTVITDSLPLIRALQFPRAALPLAYVLIELQQMLLSMAVLAVIILITGEPLTWYWLLAIPALLLQSIFNVGVGLFVARLGSQVNDFSQLLPFLLRTWMYVSGVLFNIATLSIGQTHRWLVALLQLNPAALYITLIRNALLETQRKSAPGSATFNPQLCTVWKTLGHGQHPTNAQLYDSAHCAFVANPDHFWYYAIGWAVVAFILGFWFFWRSEAKYGRG